MKYKPQQLTVSRRFFVLFSRACNCSNDDESAINKRLIVTSDRRFTDVHIMHICTREIIVN